MPSAAAISVPKRQRLTADTAREDSDAKIWPTGLLRWLAAAEIEKAGTPWQILTQMDMGNDDISFTCNCGGWPQPRSH